MEIVKYSNSNFLDTFLKNFSSEHTRRAYAKDLCDFFDFLTFKPSHPDQLIIENFVNYRESMSGKGLSSNSINRKMSSLKSLMKWCVTSGIIKFNPADSVRSIKASVDTPTLAFSNEEITMMINSPDVTTFIGIRDKLILALLFNLGIRRSELINIKLKDRYTDREHEVLRIIGKGNKLREVPLNSKVRGYISEYYSKLSNLGITLNKEDFLIQTCVGARNEKPIDGNSIYRIVKKYTEQCGIDKRMSPHSCRATAVSYLLEIDESVRNIADFVAVR